MDKIILEEMEFYAFHGCYKEEQLIGNTFFVTLELSTDSSLASSTDDVHDTVSYLDVYQLVKKEMMITSAIMEHVCKRILSAIHEYFPKVVSSKIKMSKINPPLGGKVGAATIIMEERNI